MEEHNTLSDIDTVRQTVDEEMTAPIRDEPEERERMVSRSKSLLKFSDSMTSPVSL